MGDLAIILTIFMGGTLVHGVILNGILGSLFGKRSYFIIGWKFWAYGGLLYALHTVVATVPPLLRIREYFSP